MNPHVLRKELLQASADEYRSYRTHARAVENNFAGGDDLRHARVARANCTPLGIHGSACSVVNVRAGTEYVFVHTV